MRIWPGATVAAVGSGVRGGGPFNDAEARGRSKPKPICATRANWRGCCGPEELTPVYTPEPTDEAIRDLCRARTDAVDDRRRSRHRLKGFLLRQGYRYQGRSNWSAAHERYLRELVLPHPAMKVILEEYLMSIKAAGERIARCETAMRELLEQWGIRALVVRALMAMKGFQTVAAMILVSELGEVHRFGRSTPGHGLSGVGADGEYFQ